MKTSHRPSWQLPPGVSRGTWDYVNDGSIASEYDAFHGKHPLMQLDREIVQAQLLPIENRVEQPLLIDLGCGTGRTILPVAERGWRTLGVDLSHSMLAETRRKSSDAQSRIGLLQANIVELNFLRDGIADVITCLYSSLGMVQTRKARQDSLQHVSRLLKADGLFILHVHNRGNWITFPAGWHIYFQSWWHARLDRSAELGDRIYPYRGLPTMFLHIYSLAELQSDLRSARLLIEELHVLNKESSGPLARSWFLPSIRAGGFIAIAKRDR